MFAIFKNDELVDFWSNQVGDIFIAATCRNLKMDEEQVDLVHFTGLESIPDYYEFSSSKQLIVKERHVEITEVINTDAEGNELVVQEEQVSFIIKETFEPKVYFSKGLMLHDC
jgi:hypothetical protein